MLYQEIFKSLEAVRWNMDTDIPWEDKVVERILHNLSLLFDQKFKSVQELNRYRKEINKNIEIATEESNRNIDA